jgi:4-carboxymuconolactone decarboxylase
MPLKPEGNVMSRIRDITPDQLTPEQDQIFKRLVANRGRLLGPYRIWIYSPTIANAMEQIGTHLNTGKAALSQREVEIGIILVAQYWDGDYVRKAHIRLGKMAGLSDETIDAVIAGRDPQVADPHERAFYRFATAQINREKLSDAEFAELEQVLGRDGIAETLVLLGYYSSVAMAMKVHEVPFQPPPG